MVATRKDRGNSWASRARLNDDSTLIVAKGYIVQFGQRLFTTHPHVAGYTFI